MSALIPILATEPAPRAWAGIVRYLNPVGWWPYDDPQAISGAVYTDHRSVTDIAHGLDSDRFTWVRQDHSIIPGDPYGYSASSGGFTLTTNTATGPGSASDARLNSMSGSVAFTFKGWSYSGIGDSITIQRYSQDGGDWRCYFTGTQTLRVEAKWNAFGDPDYAGADSEYTGDIDLAPYNDGKPHLVVLSWDAVPTSATRIASTMRCHIDGVQKSRGTGPIVSKVDTSQDPSLHVSLVSEIDDVLYFDRRLTNAEQDQLYDGWSEAYASPQMIAPSMSFTADGDVVRFGSISTTAPAMSFSTTSLGLVEMPATIALTQPKFGFVGYADAQIIGPVETTMPSFRAAITGYPTPAPQGYVELGMPAMGLVAAGRPVLTDPDVPITSTGVVRWTFEDVQTAETFTFPVNPQTATSPWAARKLSTAYGVRNGLARLRSWEERPEAVTWTFTGKAYSQQQYDDLNAWVRRPGIVRVTNHLGQTWDVLFQGFKPTDRRNPALAALDRYSYEITATILRGNRMDTGRPAFR